jgi:hypothetical protein
MLPIIFENSKVPRLLSKIAPIEVGGFSFFIFVFTKYSATKTLVNHETTHYLQQKEMLFVFQWVCYLLWYLVLLPVHKNGAIAYRKIPFEIEAYTHQYDDEYNSSRKPFSWVKYIKESFRKD